MRLTFLIEGYLPVRLANEELPGGTYLDIGHGFIPDGDGGGDYEDIEGGTAWFLFPDGDIIEGQEGHINLEADYRAAVASGRYDPNTSQISFVPMNRFPKMARKIPEWVISTLHERWPEAEEVVIFTPSRYGDNPFAIFNT